MTGSLTRERKWAFPDDDDVDYWNMVGEGQLWGSMMGPGSIGRSFCVTERVFIGLVPPSMKPGHEIWVLLGATIPYVLRHKLRSGHVGKSAYWLVGECYIDEMMDGEIFESGWKEVDVILE